MNDHVTHVCQDFVRKVRGMGYLNYAVQHLKVVDERERGDYCSGVVVLYLSVKEEEGNEHFDFRILKVVKGQAVEKVRGVLKCEVIEQILKVGFPISAKAGVFCSAR